MIVNNKKISTILIFLIIISKIIFSQSLTKSITYNTTELTAKTSKTVFADIKNNFTDGLTRTQTDQKLGITINLGDYYTFGKNSFSTSVTFTLSAMGVPLAQTVPEAIIATAMRLGIVIKTVSFLAAQAPLPVVVSISFTLFAIVSAVLKV